MLVMRRSLEMVIQMGIVPSRFLVDGVKEVPGVEIPQKAIERGDQSEIAIAAASVIAKVYRDNIIIELAKKYPYYKLESNKGYHSPFHASALRKLGMTPSHRFSFCRNYTTKYNAYTDF
jgi:ribonuclease HII